MAVTIEKLTLDAMALAEGERAQLAYALLKSLDGEAEEAVEEAWDEEIARRVEGVLDGSDPGMPADEVFREIRAKYLG